ncbi:MAG: hypothetical protein KDK04_00535 [Candidatus Competibacteraceae bacterium]|nr:hypothetical protein [Candidatus Competibacteraceae bacterium]
MRASGRFDDIELLSPATIYYPYLDHLDTVRAITDASQTVIWRWDSALFDDTLPEKPPTVTVRR